MHTFDTTTPISAVLDLPVGRVQVVAADRSDTTIDVRPADPSKGRDVAAAEQTTVSFDGGLLRVDGSARAHVLGHPGAVEVTVQLPAGSRLEATVASGDVRGVGRLGDVVVEGSHGSVTLDEVATARVTVGAGDVSVGRLHGPAQISTGQGDIRIAEAVRGSLELRTEVGDVTVGATPGVSASLDGGTSYGRIEHALSTTGGTTELAIHATTAYGDISARSL